MGGNVKLEFKRLDLAGTVVSHVRLRCLKLDYFGGREMLLATGPGNIELNNINAPPPPEGAVRSKLDMEGPCIAVIEGFEKLRWFTSRSELVANGSDDSLNLSYAPIVDGALGMRVWAATSNCRASFVPMADGKSKLGSLLATGAVYYQEDDGNIFLGTDKLDYDAETGLMTITSRPNDPCFVNGAMVKQIDYNLITGRLQFEQSSAPGVLVLPEGSEPD